MWPHCAAASVNELFQSDVLHKKLTWEQSVTDFDALQLRQEFYLWTPNTGTPARYFLACLTSTCGRSDPGVN